MDNAQRIAQLEAENQDLRQQLGASKAAFLNAVGKSHDGTLILNGKGIIVYSNAAAVNIFGQSLGELIGKNIGLSLENKQPAELTVEHKERGRVVIEVTIAAIEWEGADAYLASLRDRTERKKIEDDLYYFSKHDFLTGLPNRLTLEEDLKKTIARASRSNTLMALLYLDLDNFKKVNDSLGHDVGDELLRDVAGLLTQSIRVNDAAYRLGGDEFAIVLDGIKQPLDAAKVAKKIIDKFAEPRVFSNREFFINTSVGIAIYPYAGEQAQELTKCADVAMYSAKRSGKGNYQYYTKSLSKELESQLSIDTHLHKAIENDEFRLVYQPQIEMQSGRIVGFEALLRWNQAQLGNVSPEVFIPVAEESGLIVPIGQWVLEQSIAELAKIDHHTDYKLSVNLSFVQLQQTDIVATIIDALHAHGIAPSNFCLELTESVLMREPEHATKKIDELVRHGITFSIDDYGTGYSSLAYLKKIAVSYLKIDKSFVSDLLRDTNDTAIVRSTLSLAHELGMSVVAEGIEEQEQYDFLKEHGCDVGQGYLIAKPMTLKELQIFLSNHQADAF